jgi:hypothetical protein
MLLDDLLRIQQSLRRGRDVADARLRGYGGMLAGGIAGEIPRGYGMLANLAATGDINQAVDYGNRVGEQFMPEMNPQVMQDMQQAAPMIQGAGDWANNAAINVEQFTGAMDEQFPALKHVPGQPFWGGQKERESVWPSFELGAELAGVDWAGKGLKSVSRALPNIEDMNWNPRNPMNAQAGMVAWHGSPHKHSGLLDPTKIGTGEGAQAYGYGHYLAENPDVAGTYSKQVPASGGSILIDGKPASEVTEKGSKLATQFYEDIGGNYDVALKNLKGRAKWQGGEHIDAYEWLKNNQSRISRQEGSLYEYDLPDNVIDDMLDWDAPLSEQPEKVQRILKSLDGKPDSPYEFGYQAMLDNDFTGGDLYENFGRQTEFTTDLVPRTGSPSLEEIGDIRLPPKQVSKKLQQLGIPGIKYYDGGSRAAGEGTRNFVIFPGNEDLVKPLTRNDLVKPLTRNGEPLQSKSLGEVMKGQGGYIGTTNTATDDIVAATQKQGGYTINPNTGKTPSGGIMVGGFGDELVTDQLTSGLLGDYIQRNQSLLADPDSYLGTWVDDGKTYLDISRSMPNTTRANTDLARQAGFGNDRIALWDIGKGSEVAVPGARFKQYPETDAPEIKFNKDGSTYQSKKLTQEGERTRELRQSAQQDIDEGIAPEYFPVSERYYADPSSYGDSFDTKQILPKKQETTDAWTLKYDTPEARQNLTEAFEIGNADPGSTQWYAMGQLQDAFIDEFGLEEGLKRFKTQFADSMAATTGGAPPTDNLLMAHYMNTLKEQGLPLTDKSYELPYPIGAGQYGLKNLQTADKLLRGSEGITPTGHPKRYSFDRNFLGDLSKSTIDEQMMGGFGVTNTKGTPLKSPNYYGIPEKVLEDMANGMGLPVAEAQDAMWAGLKAMKAAKKAGVPVSEVAPHGKPMIAHVNEMLYRTSKVTGETMDEVLNRFLHSKGAMYSGLLGAPVAAGMLNQEQQQNY